MKHTEQTKNHQGGYKQEDQDYTDVRMYEIPVPSTTLDPVAALKLMLSKLHPSCEALFQTPLINFDISRTCWFKYEPMGKNAMSQLMPKISKRLAFHKFTRFNNNTFASRRGNAKQMCAITKRKNGQSLNSYIKDSSSSLKRVCSSILSRALTSNEAMDCGQNTCITPVNNAGLNVSLSSYIVKSNPFSSGNSSELSV